MSLETWVLFVIVAFLPAISPGPAILLAISNALRFGVSATLWSALGNALGLFLLGYAVTMGLGAIMAASAAVFTVIKVLGACYLIYLGVKLLRNKQAFQLDMGQAAVKRSGFQFFLTALIVAVTNPKAIILIAALFPQFITAGRVDLVEIGILSFTYAVMCYLNHLLLAVFAGRLRGFLRTEKATRWLRRGIGGAFIGFGALLATASR